MIICMKTRINVFLIKKWRLLCCLSPLTCYIWHAWLAAWTEHPHFDFVALSRELPRSTFSRLVRQSSVGSAALSWCSELDKRVRWYGKGNYGSTRKLSSFYCRPIYNHYVNANVLYIHAGDDTNVALWRHVAIIHYLPDPTVEPVLRTRDVKCTLYISTSIRYVKWNFEV